MARQVDNQVDPVSFLLGVLICKCIWIFCPHVVFWGRFGGGGGGGFGGSGPAGFFAAVAAGLVAGMVEESSSSSSSSLGGVSSLSPGALLSSPSSYTMLANKINTS